MNAFADPNDFVIPSRRTEDWKYSDLRRHLREVPELAGALAEAIQPGGPFREIAAEEIVIANGRLNWWSERTIDGVEVSDAATANDGAGPGVPVTAATMPLGALAAAKTPDMMIIRVSGSEPRTVSLRLVSKAIGGAIYGRVGIVVEAGARLTLLEFVRRRGWRLFRRPPDRDFRRRRCIDRPNLLPFGERRCTVGDIRLCLARSWRTFQSDGAPLRRQAAAARDARRPAGR